MAGIQSCELGSPIRLTATGNVKPSEGGIIGFYVSSTVGGTIQFFDSATTETTRPLTGVITPAVGAHGLSFAFPNGLYAVITGTIDLTASVV